MRARDFTDLAAWQLAHELRKLVIAITDRPPARRDFKFCDQIRDAARSDEELSTGTTLSKRAIGAANALIRYLMNNPDIPD